jgi:Domain of unknown function (DUF4434)
MFEIVIRAILTSLLAFCVSTSKAEAQLQGTFIDPRGWTSSDVNSFMNEIDNLHFDTVIIWASKVKSGGCTSNSYSWVPGFPGIIGNILDAAHAHGISVYVGTVNSSETCPVFYAGTNKTNTVAETASTVSAISTMFGQHPAFAGWYLPDEPALAYWNTPESSHAYYWELVQRINGILDRSIVVSPYLSGGMNKTPAQIGQRALNFKLATGVDIQAWQDSVGAGPIHLTTNTLGNYFSALSVAIGSASLWADNELFSWGSDSSSLWYLPASIYRINEQLYQTRSPIVSKRVSWLAQAHMSRIASGRLPGSERLFDSYRALYGISGTFIIPTSYSWITSPAQNYPDSGNELADAFVGASDDPIDSRWSGILGNTTIVLSLGGIKTFDWVGIHLLRKGAWAIYLPTNPRDHLG